MTLTVRLPLLLDRALDQFCALHGRTKSEVVQQALSEHMGRATQALALTDGSEVSAGYAAFKRAGLIGHMQPEPGPRAAARRGGR